METPLADILGKDKKSWMFSNWVKAEKFSGLERSGFLELSWRLWFPRFHGLIKCRKSWERREVKHWNCAPRSLPLLGTARACSLKSGIRDQMNHWVSCYRVEAFRVQRHLAETLCQVSFQNFTATIGWWQAAKHCGNLFISQYPRPSWPCVLQVLYGGLWGCVGQAWGWLGGHPCLHTSSLFACWWETGDKFGGRRVEKWNTCFFLSTLNLGRRQYVRRRETCIFRNTFCQRWRLSPSFPSYGSVSLGLHYCGGSVCSYFPSKMALHWLFRDVSDEISG